MGDIKDKVAIIGMGCTQFGELWNKGAEDLIVDACSEALEDAGVAIGSDNASRVGVSIGTAMGGRDHTTILYGVNKIAEEIEKDDNLRREVLSIRERLYRNGSH